MGLATKKIGRRSSQPAMRVEQLERRDLLAADPVISEFQASNGDTLLDGYGNSPDWIEIYNAGDEAADLSQYRLSDDPDQPSKWAFPEGTSLPANDYLVVFASDLNEPDPDGNLHTNFRLGSNGEYIGLYTSAGEVVSEFGTDGEEYPKQFRDTSYGTGEASPPIELVRDGSLVEYLIPNSDDLGDTWTNADFVAGPNWTGGVNGLGFAPEGGGTILQLDVNDDDAGESGASNVEEGWESFTLSDNGSVYNGIKVTLSELGGIPIDDRDRTTPNDAPPNFTYDQVYDDFVFARSQTNGTGLRLLLENLQPGQFYDVTLWSFDTGSVGRRISNWTEVSSGVPVVIESSYDFDGNESPTSNNDHTLTARLQASADGTLDIQGVRNGGTSFGVFLNGLQLSVPDPGELIQTDVGAAMSGRSSSFVRYPFIADVVDAIDTLSLDVKYDSGFVAYLNGIEVARRNVAGAEGTPVGYDATATVERSVEASLNAESIDLSNHTELLQQGENVLAVHALNSAADDVDFFLQATLSGGTSGPQNLYFAEPTPGAENNSQGFLGFVQDTTFSVDRGFYTDAFEVEITTDTPDATLVYTTDGSTPTLTNGTRVEPAAPGQTPVASVPISTTSYVRVFGFKDSFLSSNVDTQSYIFLEDVLQQDPTNDPNAPNYPLVWQANAPADFEMDAEVVAQWDDNDPNNTDFGIREALTSIPTMSVVMDHDDLWSESDGIYRHSDRRGERYRRPASVEYFDPATGEEFQVNAGIQVHGGASRDNVRLKKHSFRLLFRNDFGDSTLDFPLFEETDNTEFNTLVLRAFFTDAFGTRSVTDRYNPIESQYLRDLWMKDSLAAMGQTSTHNSYVHLYINGLYWGLYNPAERPDEAFLATYLGGEREDWDVVKDFNELFSGSKTGWNNMFELARDMESAEDPEAIYYQLQGRNPDGTRNEEFPVLLDVDSLADFMILHLYAGVEDWPHHNWYAGMNRNADEGYKFFVWDQEIAIDPRFRDRTEVEDRFTPAELYHHLRTNSEEFRQLYADRVQKHLFNGGALTVENARERYISRAEEIEKAIIGESARWGDAREGERITIQSGTPRVTVPTMTVNEWREERDKILNDYMPEIYRLFLERSAEIDLTGDANAPTFNQFGGVVDSGFQLTMSAPQDPLLITTEIKPENSPVRAFVPRDGSLDSSNANIAPPWALNNFDDAAWLSGTGGVGFDNRDDYVPLLGIDLLGDDIPVEQSMDADQDGSNDSLSVYTRFSFDLDAGFDPADFDRLTLHMKYDDGFVAYLNGTLVASQNSTVPPEWDERATRSHEANVGAFDDYDISDHISNLLPGQENVLAVHLVNRTASSSDFVVSTAMSLGRFQDVGEAPIYYTFDGSDPRQGGGSLSPDAVLYRGPISIEDSVQVRARAFVENLWSAETVTEFQVTPTTLAITEVHYNPLPPTQEELVAFPAAERSDLEFIELHNADSTESVSLLGLSFTDGVDFDFSNVSLEPNEYGVIVSNEVMFRARYGDDIRVLGQYEGRLNDAGESLRLEKSDGSAVVEFAYADSDPWAQRADGVGASLELISVTTPLNAYSQYDRWQGSSQFGGTPGAAADVLGGVVINEVLSRTNAEAGQVDAIEILNRTDADVIISGWYLSDSSEDLRKYQIPANSMIPANSYLVIDETQFNPTPATPLPNHFGLDGGGRDDVWLTRPVGNDALAFVDDVHFGASKAGESWGRFPNGTGRLTTVADPNLGSANVSSRVGPVLISEVMYAPTEPSNEALALWPELSTGDLEYVELFNPTGAEVDLADWELDGGIDIRFDAGTMLAAQGTVVVVPFNPTRPNNAARTAAFRAHYGIADDVTLVGGFDRQLANEGELLQLYRLDSSLADPNTVLEDELIYTGLAPWPDANGNGSSLQRIADSQPGYFAGQWDAMSPTPGVASLGDEQYDINQDGVVDIVDVDTLCSALTSGGDFDLNGDGVTDQDDVSRLLARLGSRPGDLNQDGIFDSSDLVRAFQLGEYEDGIDGNSRWSEGDWNCDGDFTTTDFVFALQLGGYSAASSPSGAQAEASTSPALGADFNLQRIGAAVDELFGVDDRDSDDQEKRPEIELVKSTARRR